MGLTLGQESCSGEVFKVLDVCDDIKQSRESFEVVSPTLECFKDGQEFLIVNVIIQLCGVESPGVKHDW